MARYWLETELGNEKIRRYNNSAPYVTARWPPQQIPLLNFLVPDTLLWRVEIKIHVMKVTISERDNNHVLHTQIFSWKSKLCLLIMVELKYFHGLLLIFMFDESIDIVCVTDQVTATYPTCIRKSLGPEIVSWFLDSASRNHLRLRRKARCDRLSPPAVSRAFGARASRSIFIAPPALVFFFFFFLVNYCLESSLWQRLLSILKTSIYDWF